VDVDVDLTMTQLAAVTQARPQQQTGRSQWIDDGWGSVIW